MAEEKKPLPVAEIVTGVLIVVILLVFALPRYMDWDEKDATSDQATALFYELMKAKNRAIQIKNPVWVEFDSQTGYTVFEDPNNNGQADSGEPVHNVPLAPEVMFGVNLNPPLDNVWGTGKVQKGIELDGGATRLSFNSKGTASNTGAVYFINKADMGKTNQYVRAVKILGTTGEISVVKPSPGDTPPWK